MQSRRRAIWVGSLLASVLGLGACGGAAAPVSPASSPGAPGAASSAAASTKPAASAAAGASVKPAGNLPAVRIAQSVPTLSFAPLIVARDLGYFEKQGVKLEFTQLQSGSTAQQAVIGGSVDLVNSASTEVVAAAAQGAPVQAIQGTIKMTLEVCASKKWMDSKGVTASSSLEQRMAAFKGGTIGITGPGAVSDRAMRWLLQKYGKLNPDTDTTIISTGSEGLIGGLQQGRLQGFLQSPPNCELAAKDGAAIVLVKPSEVPEFGNYIHEVLYSTSTWASSHKDLATKAATALSMGNNYLLQHPAEGTAVVQKAVSSVPADIVNSAMKDIILPQVGKDGKMSPDQWQATNQVLLESGMIKQPMDVSEGKVWTNAYIGDAKVP